VVSANQTIIFVYRRRCVKEFTGKFTFLFACSFIFYLNGLKRIALSMFSGSVISGKNAAPPSDDDTTNLTADHTAMF
jgi:uncharacterized membrane protein (DUF373 family)